MPKYLPIHCIIIRWNSDFTEFNNHFVNRSKYYYLNLFFRSKLIFDTINIPFYVDAICIILKYKNRKISHDSIFSSPE